MSKFSRVIAVCVCIDFVASPPGFTSERKFIYLVICLKMTVFGVLPSSLAITSACNFVLYAPACGTIRIPVRIAAIVASASVKM